MNEPLADAVFEISVSELQHFFNDLIEKLLVLNAYIKQQIGHAKRAMQFRPPTTPTDKGVIRRAITKIGLRALAIVEHVKIIAEGKKEVAFNSAQTRDFLAGREGKTSSRRDTIRAHRRAEKGTIALVSDGGRAHLS